MSLASLLAAVAVQSAVANGVEARWFEERVPMDDGTRLYTVGTAPAPGVKCPIVVSRTPYAKEQRIDGPNYARQGLDALKRGYAVVLQHTRGSGVSEGRRVPYANEREDGLALLAFVRRLPWYNGEIYLQGGSYGNAVLSREEPVSVRRIHLPAQEPRVLLMCEFTNCWFGATHLDSGTLKGDPAPSHIMAVPAISNIVLKCAADGKPVFLTGDWNATPCSKLVATMRGFLTLISDTNHPTVNNNKKCIDYIAVDSGHAAKVKVNDAHVTPDDVTSDHKPIAVAVELGK